jgi:4-hydroxy-tetrahydrodipicolinate synthase
MTTCNLKGIIPAVIVPMRQDFSIDFDAYRRYIEWMISLAPVGLAVNVDTGEGPYLTPEERAEVIRVSRQVAAGRAAIVAGVGGPSTRMAETNAKAAREAGADALLVFPTPAFLNDPFDPQIIYDYHKAVADASDLPLVAFQLAPVFGGVNYTPEALQKVLELPQVIALKDASFDCQHFTLTRDIIRRADHEVTLLTGNDTFLLESFLLGAAGGLLGYGAAGAGLLIEMLNAVKAKRFDDAVAMQPRVQGFCDYIYALPYGDYRARSKVALVHMGLLNPDQTYVRPPYVTLWAVEQHRAREAVEKAGLLAVAKAAA